MTDSISSGMRSALLALTFLLPSMASATDVQGPISHHTVWKRSGSPYVLKGDVTVDWGTSLILEPGVQVIAASEDALRSGVDLRRVELIVDGTLEVRGTSSLPVEFTSQGGRGSWFGIRVRGGRGTVIDGALITQAYQGISLGMSATVKNTSVSAMTEDCIHVEWGTATLEGNELSGCGSGERTGAREGLHRPVLSDPNVRGRPVPTPGQRSPDSRIVVRPDPSEAAPEAPLPKEKLQVKPASGLTTPSLPSTSGTERAAAGAPSQQTECTLEPQVDESPACPGIRRWMRDHGAPPSNVRPRIPTPAPVPRSLANHRPPTTGSALARSPRPPGLPPGHTFGARSAAPS